MTGCASTDIVTAPQASSGKRIFFMLIIVQPSKHHFRQIAVIITPGNWNCSPLSFHWQRCGRRRCYGRDVMIRREDAKFEFGAGGGGFKGFHWHLPGSVGWLGALL